MKWNQFKLWEVILIVLASLLVGGVAGFIIGVEIYVHTQCLVYPFLLLNPQQWIACRLP